MRANVIKCECCGEALNISQSKKSVLGYVAACDYCGHENVLPRTQIEEEVLSELQAGKRALQNGKFDEARTSFEEVVRRDGEEPEGYFGLALANNRVLYVRDYVNNILRPVCYKPLKSKFSEDRHYKKALSLAVGEQRGLYEERAKQIDYIAERFNEYKRQNIDFDCFICAKISEYVDPTDENGGNESQKFARSDGKTRKYLSDREKTADYEYVGKAGGLYNFLKGRGYKPFFSEVHCRERAGEDYEAFILYALTAARCMVVVCSDEKYLDTPWVKNEYTRYYGFMQRGEKAFGSLTIVYGDEDIRSITVNNEAKPVQGIDRNTPEAYSLIEDFVKRFKPAEEKIEKPSKKKVERTAKDESTDDLDDEIEFITEDLDALPAKVRRLYLKAERGSKSAQYKLGVLFFNGYKGMVRDLKKAAYWYLKAAKGGHARAQFEIARCYGSGWGVDMDGEKSFKWFKKSAESGYPKAMWRTGDCYQRGHGTDENITEAVNWYKKAAKLGEKNACEALERLYFAGYGVPKSAKLAKKWKNKADWQFAFIMLSFFVACALLVGSGFYLEFYYLNNLIAYHSVGGVFWFIFAALAALSVVYIIADGVWFFVYCGRNYGFKETAFWIMFGFAVLIAGAATVPADMTIHYGFELDQDFYYGYSRGVYFELNEDDTLTAFAYNYDKEEITVPAEFNGKKVVAYSAPWMYGRVGYITQTQKVILSDGITSIGEWAFYKYAGESVSIPDSVVSIGSCAFWDCSAEIIWGENSSVTVLGGHSFGYYAGEKLTVPDGVTTIEGIAFINSRLKEIVVPDSVTVIEANAFGFEKHTTLEAVYYCGTRTQWNNIQFGYSGIGAEDSVGLGDIDIFYYSESKPEEGGNFWRYVDGKPAVWE